MRGRRAGIAVLAASLALAGGAVAHDSGGATAASGGGVTNATTSALGRDTVMAIQRKLGIRADGVYGPETRRAVRRFQRANGLLVDGIAGPQTLSALGLGAAASGSGSGGAPTALLRKIALCESGGNPRAVSPDGRYRGKYQFSRATWRALGGTGDPAKAPEALQDRLALKLLRQSGTSPWPNCA